MSFLYAILSSFMCGTCLLIIGTANPIHAILLLISVFFIGTILLFCLQMEYYASLFLIVYVGAIVVLFLFIISSLELKSVNVATRLGDLFAFRHLILLCLMLQMFFFLSSQFFDLSGFFFKQSTSPNINIGFYTMLLYISILCAILFLGSVARQNTLLNTWITQKLGSFAYNSIIFVSMIITSSGMLYLSLTWEHNEMSMTNAYLIEANQYMNWSQLIYRTDQLRSLGAILYTEYMVSVILASLLLFVSMVGALAVTLFFPKNQFSVEEINSMKSQDANNQAVRNPKFSGINKLILSINNF